MHVGLENLGNSCFFNSVLQILAHTHALRDNLTKDTNLAKHLANTPTLVQIAPQLAARLSTRRQQQLLALGDKLSLAAEIAFILQQLHAAQTNSISPTSFFHAFRICFPRFLGNGQHDAQECLRLLLERIDSEIKFASEINPELSHYSTLISGLFQGGLVYEIQCSSCKDTVSRRDPFWDISLDIPDTVFLSKVGDGQFCFRPCSLDDCLRRFCAGEPLGHYRCQKCGSTGGAVKRTRIGHFPEILSLHLKRFRWLEASPLKVSTSVEYPFELILCDDDCEDEVVYQLSGMIEHRGYASEHGHYAAYVYDVSSDVWVLYDDSRVVRLSVDQLNCVQAYILFYHKS
jgi:ubiquitin carboxyl-terminal hydrolase 12/46